MLYVLYTISASGNRYILYSSNNVNDVREWYDNNVDYIHSRKCINCFYVGCTEKPLFVLEDNLKYEKIPFDEKPYFFTMEGFYSIEESQNDDDFDDFDKDYAPEDWNDYEIF